MYAVELDRSKRLLVISAAQRVTAEQAKLAAQRVRELLHDVVPGFRVLAERHATLPKSWMQLRKKEQPQ